MKTGKRIDLDLKYKIGLNFGIGLTVQPDYCATHHMGKYGFPLRDSEYHNIIMTTNRLYQHLFRLFSILIPINDNRWIKQDFFKREN